MGDAYRAGARSRAEGVRYGVTAADHNIARPPILLGVRHRSSAWAEAYRQNRQDAHARGRGMAQNRVAATHPARDRWFESIFLQQRVVRTPVRTSKAERRLLGIGYGAPASRSGGQADLIPGCLPFTRGCANPAIRRSRPADARLGSRTLHVTADWDLRASGAAADASRRSHGRRK